MYKSTSTALRLDVWANLRRLSKQPEPADYLTNGEHKFIISIMATLRLPPSYDRIRHELIKIIERLSGERFRDDNDK